MVKIRNYPDYQSITTSTPLLNQNPSQTMNNNCQPIRLLVFIVSLLCMWISILMFIVHAQWAKQAVAMKELCVF